MQTISKRLTAGLVAAAVLWCAGCSNDPREQPVYPVTGQLFVKKKAAAGALVILTPSENATPANWPSGYPRANVRDDGSFTMTMYEKKEGAPAGDYALTVLWLVPVPGNEEMETDKLQGRYADPAASKF